MRKEELTIGDVVKCATMSYPTTYRFYEVGGVYQEGKQAIAQIKDIELGCVFNVHVEMLEPIPMTAAILTKSGFTNCTTTKIDLEMGHEYWYPGEDGFVANESILITLFAVGRFQVRMGNSVICGLEYVHELQHAFRLCNIEYEIKL